VSGDQQTARINVTDAEWLEFRTLAIRRRRSLADYLGTLVRAEISGAEDPDDSNPVRPERASHGAGGAGRVRLADQQLLTRLPRRTT
jgi:hypothetical protein